MLNEKKKNRLYITWGWVKVTVPNFKPPNLTIALSQLHHLTGVKYKLFTWSFISHNNPTTSIIINLLILLKPQKGKKIPILNPPTLRFHILLRGRNDVLNHNAFVKLQAGVKTASSLTPPVSWERQRVHYRSLTGPAGELLKHRDGSHDCSLSLWNTDRADGEAENQASHSSPKREREKEHLPPRENHFDYNETRPWASLIPPSLEQRERAKWDGGGFRQSRSANVFLKPWWHSVGEPRL